MYTKSVKIARTGFYFISAELFAENNLGTNAVTEQMPTTHIKYHKLNPLALSLQKPSW
jgi:hypothetical protein